MKFIAYTMTLFAVAASFVGCGRSGGNDLSTYKQFSSCAMMLNVASQGCEAYKTTRGNWPNSLEEIDSYRASLVQKDAWLHPLGFTPFDSAKGYGEIISYGQDGKPGGTGEDSDLVVRFPLKENADWNIQLAKSLKLPPNMQSNANWYEAYLH